MSWEQVWDPAESVVIDGETGAVYCLAASGVVYKYGGTPGSWTSIGGPSGGQAGGLFGGSDQLLAVATGSSPDIFRWDDRTSSWVRIGGPRKTFVVGKSSDAEFKLQVYGLSLDSAPAKEKGIYQWSGGWYQRGGPASAILVCQTTLFATNPVSGDLMSRYPTGWKTEWYSGDPPDFGTAIHEIAHLLLGTPDMYFTAHWPYAAARYSVSDQSGPIHLSAPEKLKLGWLSYNVATASGTYSLKDVETQHDALILYNPKRGSDEYFLIENRWRGTSYDAGGSKIGAGIPMDGIAIWHVIENPAVFDAVFPFPPTGVKGEWGRLGIRLRSMSENSPTLS
jgi:hypothetical protein